MLITETTVTTISPVEWIAGGVRFSLETNDAEIQRMAAQLFKQYTIDPLHNKADTHSSFQWLIEKTESDGAAQWEVHGLHRPKVSPSELSPQSHFFDHPQRAIMAVEYDAVGVLGKNYTGLTLHGALLEKDQQGIVIVGPCHAGKSTLSAFLWRSGWRLRGDDLSLVDCGAAGSATAIAAPRRVSIRYTSEPLLENELFEQAKHTPSCWAGKEGFIFHPHEMEDFPAPPKSPIGLKAIFLLQRLGTKLAPAQTAIINPAQAAMSLITYSNLMHLEVKLSLPQMVARFAPLVESVPVYDLGRGPLDEMMTTIENQLNNAQTSR